MLLPSHPVLAAVKVRRDNPRYGVPENSKPLAAFGPFSRSKSLGVCPPADHVVLVAEVLREAAALAPRGVAVQPPLDGVFLEKRVEDNFNRFTS